MTVSEKSRLHPVSIKAERVLERLRKGERLGRFPVGEPKPGKPTVTWHWFKATVTWHWFKATALVVTLVEREDGRLAQSLLTRDLVILSHNEVVLTEAGRRLIGG